METEDVAKVRQAEIDRKDAKEDVDGLRQKLHDARWKSIEKLLHKPLEEVLPQGVTSERASLASQGKLRDVIDGAERRYREGDWRGSLEILKPYLNFPYYQYASSTPDEPKRADLVYFGIQALLKIYYWKKEEDRGKALKGFREEMRNLRTERQALSMEDYWEEVKWLDEEWVKAHLREVARKSIPKRQREAIKKAEKKIAGRQKEARKFLWAPENRNRGETFYLTERVSKYLRTARIRREVKEGRPAKLFIELEAKDFEHLMVAMGKGETTDGVTFWFGPHQNWTSLVILPKDAKRGAPELVKAHEGNHVETAPVWQDKQKRFSYFAEAGINEKNPGLVEEDPLELLKIDMASEISAWTAEIFENPKIFVPNGGLKSKAALEKHYRELLQTLFAPHYLAQYGVSREMALRLRPVLKEIFDEIVREIDLNKNTPSTEYRDGLIARVQGLEGEEEGAVAAARAPERALPGVVDFEAIAKSFKNRNKRTLESWKLTNQDGSLRAERVQEVFPGISAEEIKLLERQVNLLSLGREKKRSSDDQREDRMVRAIMDDFMKNMAPLLREKGIEAEADREKLEIWVQDRDRKRIKVLWTDSHGSVFGFVPATADEFKNEEPNLYSGHTDVVDEIPVTRDGERFTLYFTPGT